VKILGDICTPSAGAARHLQITSNLLINTGVNLKHVSMIKYYWA
jgi:hypothetical protein